MDFRDDSEAESSVDDEYTDKSYIPSKDDEKMMQREEIDEAGPSAAKKHKPTKKPLKKNITFEEKKNVAMQISKHNNLFDITNAGYSDKRLEKATWKKISDEVGLNVEKCMQHWESLKRSAKYHARPTRDPFKSGAAADSEEVQRKYKDEWQFADVMSFYTPPALKKSVSLVSICNSASTSSKKGNSDVDMNDTSAIDDLSEIESVYVSTLNFFFYFHTFHIL